jgi:hypothetical protein
MTSARPPPQVGTTHLESPCPGPNGAWASHAAERRAQLGLALRELSAAAGPAGDALLAGAGRAAAWGRGVP